MNNEMVCNRILNFQNEKEKILSPIGWAQKEIERYNIVPEKCCFKNLDDLIYYPDKGFALFEMPGKNGALIRVEYFAYSGVVYFELDYHNREHLKLTNPEIYDMLKRTGDHIAEHLRVKGHENSSKRGHNVVDIHRYRRYNYEHD